MPKKTTFHKLFSTYLNEDIPDDATGEVQRDCCFKHCGKEGHLYVNVDDGLWQCKKCEESGNARSFLTLYHSQYLEETTEQQLKSLSKIRGISVETLQSAGFAYDYDHDRWLVPYYTYDAEKKVTTSHLNNLGYFYPNATNEKKRYKIFKAGGLPLYLYNPQPDQSDYSDHCYILEGEWDTLAYLDANDGTSDLVLGKPGSGFNRSYLKTLKGITQVHTCLDNDAGGHKQTITSVETLKTKVPHIKVLDWGLVPDSEGWDIRDLWMARPDDFNDQLQEALVEYETEGSIVEQDENKFQTSLATYDPLHSFQEYLDEVGKMLYMTEETPLSMAATFGITTSITIPGEPLWAFLISPPSAGKTIFINSFGGNNEAFDNLSKITARSLVSGWREEESSDEPSYLALLRNKTLFIKDFTVTLMDTQETQREVFGLLTDIYDGTVKIPYGNNQVKEFHDLYFNMIAGVTDIVHSHSAASIGERFLRIDYLGQNYDPRQFALRAAQNFGKKKEHEDRMLELTLGLVNHLKEQTIDMSMPDFYIEGCVDLAEFIAIIRTKVERDRKDGMKYKPRTELPARLTLQLQKLFVSARHLYLTCMDMNEANSMAFKVIQKVTTDTCYGFALEILRTIHTNPNCTAETIMKHSPLERSSVQNMLRDMGITDVLSTRKAATGGKGGRPKHVYVLNPKIQKVFDTHDNQNREGSKRPGKKRSPSSIRKPRRTPPKNRGSVR